VKGIDMTTEELLELARRIGFSHVGDLKISALQFLPEVRQMCASGRCEKYGKCWTCPPHCGTLNEIAEKAASYRRGILVQSTGKLEDFFDGETMMETGRIQKERFNSLVERVRDIYPDCLPMSSGGCTICESCACPGTPCRFPQKAVPSMEAYGLWVSDVCERSGLPYYYGPGTITYTSCILID